MQKLRQFQEVLTSFYELGAKLSSMLQDNRFQVFQNNEGQNYRNFVQKVGRLLNRQSPLFEVEFVDELLKELTQLGQQAGQRNKQLEVDPLIQDSDEQLERTPYCNKMRKIFVINEPDISKSTNFQIYQVYSQLYLNLQSRPSNQQIAPLGYDFQNENIQFKQKENNSDSFHSETSTHQMRKTDVLCGENLTYLKEKYLQNTQSQQKDALYNRLNGQSMQSFPTKEVKSTQTDQTLISAINNHKGKAQEEQKALKRLLAGKLKQKTKRQKNQTQIQLQNIIYGKDMIPFIKSYFNQMKNQNISQHPQFPLIQYDRQTIPIKKQPEQLQIYPKQDSKQQQEPQRVNKLQKISDLVIFLTRQAQSPQFSMLSINQAIYQRLVLICYDTLLGVLKDFEYFLPAGYLTNLIILIQQTQLSALKCYDLKGCSQLWALKCFDLKGWNEKVERSCKEVSTKMYQIRTKCLKQHRQIQYRDINNEFKISFK